MKNGMYQLKCSDCPVKYTGPTGCTFSMRFEQNFKAFKNNSRQ